MKKRITSGTIKTQKHRSGVRKSRAQRKMELAVMKCMSKGAAVTNALCNQYAKGKGKIKSTDVIVRYLSLDNFMRMTENRCNVLARVSTWQDVYEGLVLRLQYDDCDVANLLKDFYGQCWSLRSTESEVLWNARCPNGYGVCIKSTVGKLAQSIARNCSSEEAIAGIGRLDAVRYAEDRINNSNAVLDGAAIRHAFSGRPALLDTFFEKRFEFMDEKEIRVILDLPSGAHEKVMRRTYKGDLLFYKFDQPEDFLDEVVFHPSMNKVLCECITCHLQKNGWGKVMIGQSHLYDLPSAVFSLLS